MSSYEEALEASNALPGILAGLEGMGRHANKYHLHTFAGDHAGDLCVILRPLKISVGGQIAISPSVAALECVAKAIADLYPEILSRAVSIAQKSVDKSLLSVEQVAVELLRHIEQIKQND